MEDEKLWGEKVYYNNIFILLSRYLNFEKYHMFEFLGNINTHFLISAFSFEFESFTQTILHCKI